MRPNRSVSNKALALHLSSLVPKSRDASWTTSYRAIQVPSGLALNIAVTFGNRAPVRSKVERGGGRQQFLAERPRAGQGQAWGRCWAGLAAPSVSQQWPCALHCSCHCAGTEAAGAAAGISGDEAALPPGFYSFLFSEKKQKKTQLKLQ